MTSERVIDTVYESGRETKRITCPNVVHKSGKKCRAYVTDTHLYYRDEIDIAAYYVSLLNQIENRNISLVEFGP